MVTFIQINEGRSLETKDMKRLLLQDILEVTIDGRSKASMYTIMTIGWVNAGCRYHAHPGHSNCLELRTGRRT